MKWSVNRKIIAAGAFLLILAFLISLTPWYHAYMAYDRKWTCAKFRKNIQWNYQAIMSGSASSEEMDTQQAIAEAVTAVNNGTEYTLEVISESVLCSLYHIDGICRDGGTFVVMINAEGQITVHCDHQGHDVDYTLLPEF